MIDPWDAHLQQKKLLLCLPPPPLAAFRMQTRGFLSFSQHPHFVGQGSFQCRTDSN
jgi:hypothetical protein